MIERKRTPALTASQMGSVRQRQSVMACASATATCCFRGPVTYDDDLCSPRQFSCLVISYRH
jgi:hypothetical protein